MDSRRRRRMSFQWGARRGWKKGKAKTKGGQDKKSSEKESREEDEGEEDDDDDDEEKGGKQKGMRWEGVEKAASTWQNAAAHAIHWRLAFFQSRSRSAPSLPVYIERLYTALYRMLYIRMYTGARQSRYQLSLRRSPELDSIGQLEPQRKRDI